MVPGDVDFAEFALSDQLLQLEVSNAKSLLGGLCGGG